ncbi:hypothetical protein [Streptomyces sp. NPDC001978]|uniref:hypothetical protein n=1 Tax=Streptomyces sp. NPDC001978 TaxID=3364627 RepID=UPI0036BE5AE9
MQARTYASRAVRSAESAPNGASFGRTTPWYLARGTPFTLSARKAAVTAGRPVSPRSTVVYGTPSLLSRDLMAATGAPPSSTTSTLRSMRGCTAADAPGAPSPSVTSPATVTAAAVALQRCAYCLKTVSLPQKIPRNPTSVYRRTGDEGPKVATTPHTGERPQE